MMERTEAVNMVKVKIDDIKVLSEVYPRSGFDNETVNAYRLNIDNLPEIIVTKELILVDGYHRLLAHKLEGRQEIECKVLDIPKENILWYATKFNAVHGLQLKIEEKRKLARIFYTNHHKSYSEIAEVLAVSEATLSEWLTDIRKKEQEEQRKQIVDLYLQCHTLEEISKKLDIAISTVHYNFEKFKTKVFENPPTPESLQLYNVWNFPNRDTRYGLDMEGAIPGQIVENVLYYWTEPFDIVVDPMAGSGTTIDVCKAMYRRYRAYDINPIREDIKKHDIRKGYPKECKNADLIFLDPPYFNMVFKDFFKDVNEFYDFIRKLAEDSYDTIKQKGTVAILMQDMTELGNYCLSGETYCIFRCAGFHCVSHISVPLATQQFLPQQVEKAKTERHLLGRNRDLYIFQKRSE